LDDPPGNTLLIIFSDQRLLYFSITAVFLIFSAWISSVEAAFFALNTDDVERFKNSSDEREKTVARLLAKPRLLLNSLTASKYTSILASAVLSVVSFYLTGENVRVFPAGATVLLLTMGFALVGVILAKIHGTTYPASIARRNSRLCKKLIFFFKPFVQPLLRASIRVEKKLDAKTEEKSVEELTQVLQLATVDNDPVEGEKEILEGIVNFGTLKVKQVMRPKTDISYTDISLDFHQLLEFVKRSGYSRVPVCRGSIDKVEGFLYIKDLLPFLKEGAGHSWQKLLRPGYFVSDSKKVDFLLKDFQEKRVHMALVVNSHNSTVGLITLEDIIEEIIGEINDEFDEPGLGYHKLSEQTFIFDGKTSLHEFCKILHIDPTRFQPVKGMNESLSGMLVEVNEQLPAVGDTIEIEPFTFVVESVDHKRIKKIRVQINEEKTK
jgi:putative hemolysin